jgi:hypothetical protein
LSLLPGIQRAAQDILRFCMGVFLGLVFGTHCHQSGLDIGFGRIVPHGLAQGCLCLGLLRNKPATKAGTTRGHREEDTGTTRTGDNARGAKTTQKTTTTSAAGASHHSQPSRQHGVVLFRDGSPRGSIRHHELLTERPIIACGSEFPLPPPAGPPGPDPPPASASGLAHPSTELAKINMLARTTLKAMVCLRFTLRTSLPS